MDISGISAGLGASSTGSSTTAKSATVDYNAFLRLLVAQLKNQDPTNPTEGAEFLSQLASFSSVEQGVQTNAKLDSILRSSLLDQAGGIVGRVLTSADGSVSGPVESVLIESDGLLARLVTGEAVRIAEGVRVS